MKKYAVIVPNYPSEQNPAIMNFVHKRVKAYKKSGLNVTVLVPSTDMEARDYEGVPVIYGNVQYLKERIKSERYDKFLIHFLDRTATELVENAPCIVWVHGYEALSWKRRLFNLNYKFLRYIILNIKQLKCFRDFAKTNQNCTFIFVSEWMKMIASKDVKLEFSNYAIIPNFIDPSIFKYDRKKGDQRKKILMIRSFESKKYASDISLAFIKQLEKKPFFGELEIDIWGRGRYLDDFKKALNKYNNITIHDSWLNEKEIYQEHKMHGVFLCPTRQDAQGVSMCEAMSSGLIPLTSRNTAIPEFIPMNAQNILCDNRSIDSFVKVYEKFYSNEKLFFQYSKSVSDYMKQICSEENTVEKEINLIKK